VTEQINLDLLAQLIYKIQRKIIWNLKTLLRFDEEMNNEVAGNTLSYDWNFFDFV
jgi:hypothetical protein